MRIGANWNTNWRGILAHPANIWHLVPMSLFGLFVVVAGVPLWRLLRRWGPRRATPDIS
jgi:hypothetical protein